jgi:hypothetical protein
LDLLAGLERDIRSAITVAAKTKFAHFQETLERLVHILVFGKTNLKIGLGIRDQVMTDDVIHHAAPIFWGFTMLAHLDVAQHTAFKLFDRRRDTVTIEYLLKNAGECVGLFPKKKTELQKTISDSRIKIAALGSHLKPVREKRHRILAHTDTDTVKNPERLAKECAVTFADVEAVFETAGDILNGISVAYRGISLSFELLEDDDFQMAIQLVADGKHAQAERFEQEFGSPSPYPRPKRPKSPY